MARSYHTTRRQLKEEEGRCYSYEKKRAESIERLKDELDKKRRAKRHVRFERRASFPEAGVTPIESIRFQVRDSSEYLHYPASAEDIRELLKTMPAGIVDGLSKISFCLGAERQSPPDHPWSADTQPDPFLGRFGYEVLPGVYMGRCLGTYYIAKAEIRLHGYVYNPELVDRSMWELYLRLHMLMTFVHEIAHHYDFTFRIGRGRWRGDSNENAEIYAEVIQHKWLNEYVIPFLEKRYPEECAMLRSWMRRHAGLEIPLHVVAGDPRTTAKNGLIRACSFFDTAEAFQEFVAAVNESDDAVVSRIEFADALHMANEYHLALDILELILASDQRHVKALTLKADIYVHLEKYAEAIGLAQQALSIQPDCIDAYDDLVNAYEELKNWAKVVELCDTIIALLPNDKRWEYASALWSKAISLAEMGDSEGAETLLCEMETINPLTAKRFRRRLSDRSVEG